MGRAMKLWQKLKFPKPKSEASKGKLSLWDNEIYTGIEVPPGPFFLRLDGWKFHRLLELLKLEKPFDKRLATALLAVAREILTIFNGTTALLFSDEISLYFPKPSAFARIEKLDSVVAGMASSRLVRELQKMKIGGKELEKLPLAFDCRVIPIQSEKAALRYLAWRQAEAFRNGNNGWAQWVAINKEKLSPNEANKRLAGMKTRELNKYCKKHGVNFSKLPSWQFGGVMLVTEPYKKKGYDPIRKKAVSVTRRRLAENWEPPNFIEILRS